jgi:hypothetical protein
MFEPFVGGLGAGDGFCGEFSEDVFFERGFPNG